MFRKRHEPSLAVELLGGIAAGIFASWVMAKAQSRINRMGSPRTRAREKAAAGAEPATFKAAQMAVRPFGVRLTKGQKKTGGQIVHYAYGALWGAAFAALNRRSPLPGVVNGVLFGAALWALSDELLVPLFGFSKSPAAYPASTHMKALAAHVVYGATTARAQHLVRHFA